ncbi:hypothetical protein GCM10022410_18810 [Amphibacillus indicireducens]|uniref:Uncharacterized protein n=1 Tax=Amphibacillus indicireducens TaxID=1076330 RepID=A0ABP7VSZ6_9BACI
MRSRQCNSLLKELIRLLKLRRMGDLNMSDLKKYLVIDEKKIKRIY